MNEQKGTVETKKRAAKSICIRRYQQMEPVMRSTWTNEFDFRACAHMGLDIDEPSDFRNDLGH